MNLDVESLRAFTAVVDTGGITSAANVLGLSQSAVSWKIKRLEERVGRDLLIRNGRSLRPSRDGEELLGYARQLVGTHDEAVARLSSSELTGRLKLGATEEVCADCIGPVVGRFDRVHPGVTIEIRVDTGRRLDDLVGRGELDLAIIQVAVDDRRRNDRLLWIDEQRWISSPHWTYEEGTVPLVTFGEMGFYRPLAERVLTEAGVPYRVAFSGPSSASVLAAVEAGLGVAVLSGRSVAGEVIDWPRAEQLPDLPPVHQIVRAAPGDNSAVVTELIAEIEQVLGEV